MAFDILVLGLNKVPELSINRRKMQYGGRASSSGRAISERTSRVRGDYKSRGDAGKTLLLSQRYRWKAVSKLLCKDYMMKRRWKHCTDIQDVRIPFKGT